MVSRERRGDLWSDLNILESETRIFSLSTNVSPARILSRILNPDFLKRIKLN